MDLENIKLLISESGPSFVASIFFLQYGLSMGYTYSSFVVERYHQVDIIYYGPLFLGILIALLIAGGLVFLKYYTRRMQFLHFELLAAASICYIIAGGFFFALGYDNVGGFISFVADAIVIISGLSYLHAASSKEKRTVFLSSCYIWYMLGIASAVSIISNSYVEPAGIIPKNTVDNTSSKDTNTEPVSDNKEEAEQLIVWPYLNFAWLFMCCAIFVAALAIAIVVLKRYSFFDCSIISDDELRNINSNSKIFDDRKKIIKRVQDTRSFFYVTKSRQWLVSFTLLFADAIYNALFTYMLYWFSLNTATRLTDTNEFGGILWVVFLGCIFGTVLSYFVSIKTIFISTLITNIAWTLIGIIIYAATSNDAMFWVTCLYFGTTFANLKILILETSPFLLVEAFIFVFFTTDIIAIGLINCLFVSNLNNVYFYGGDSSTLIAHSLSLMLLLSMLAVMLASIIWRTFKSSLLDIQYRLLGIIFTHHNIEQLNIGYLEGAQIPIQSATNPS